jgi:hypothetical protein
MKDYVIDQCIDCPAGSADKVCQIRNNAGEMVAPPNHQIGVMFAKMGGETDGRAAAKKIGFGALGAAK